MRFFAFYLRISKKSSNFAHFFSNSMDTLNDTLYYALQGLETHGKPHQPRLVLKEQLLKFRRANHIVTLL